MDRRNFIKGAIAASVLTALPIAAEVKEEVNILNNCAPIQGLERKPGESDDELRKRILDKINEPLKSFSYNGNPFQIEQ